MHAIFDREMALQQAGGNEALALELLAMLIRETPALLAALREAHAAGNRQALWDTAHKIYGSTAYCGVPELNHTARVLEEAIKAGLDGSVVSDELRALELAFERLREHSADIIAAP